MVNVLKTTLASTQGPLHHFFLWIRPLNSVEVIGLELQKGRSSVIYTKLMSLSEDWCFAIFNKCCNVCLLHKELDTRELWIIRDQPTVAGEREVGEKEEIYHFRSSLGRKLSWRMDGTSLFSSCSASLTPHLHIIFSLNHQDIMQLMSTIRVYYRLSLSWYTRKQYRAL